MSERRKVLHLLGIEAWQLRTTPAQTIAVRPSQSDLVAVPEPGAAPRQNMASDARTRSAAAAPKFRDIDAPATRGRQLATTQPSADTTATDRAGVTRSSAGQTWRLQLDLFVAGDLLIVQTCAPDSTATRFVRDVAAALSRTNAPPTHVERFEWPPAGNLELARREPCRAALLAVLLRRWQTQELRVALVMDHDVFTLLRDEGAQMRPAVQRIGALPLLLVPQPEQTATQSSLKRELWSVIQQWHSSQG